MSAGNGTAGTAGSNGSAGSVTALPGPAADPGPGQGGEPAPSRPAGAADGVSSAAGSDVTDTSGPGGRRAALDRLAASAPGLVARSLAADSVDAVWSLAINMIAGSPLMPRVGRILMYKLAGMRIGRTQVYSQVTFGRPWVTFGDDCMINRGCVFDNLSRVTFGSKVRVGQEVMFCTSTHHLGGARDRASVPGTSAPIVVGDGCWIGSRAVLLPGVTVGDGCVIAAGAVVSKDCEPNGLYAGVPARRVRDLPV